MKIIPLRATRAQIMATRGAADVTTVQQFYILMKNMSKKAIHVPKHVTVAWAKDPPNTMATTDISSVDHNKSNSSDMPSKDLNDVRNVVMAVH